MAREKMRVAERREAGEARWWSMRAKARARATRGMLEEGGDVHSSR